MQTRFKLLMSTVLTLVAVPVLAQTAAPTAAAVETDGIDEIIVTAQRVEERLQDIPLAVTAISGGTLVERNITDATQLQQLAPGLSIGRSGSDVRPSIRGINTEAIGANSDPRIGFYIDDVYQSRTSQAMAAFVDLERVEVLRGPQGTLYGRNSFGGNIALYSATPKDEFSAGGNLLYGSFNRFRGEGHVNVPIAPGISARVAGMYERMDGYVKNSSTGSDLGDEDQYFVRGTLRFAPDGSDLEILLRGSYWKQGGNGISAFGYKSLGTPIDPSLIRQPGQTLQVGNRAVVMPAGFNGGSAFGVNAGVNSRFRDGIPDVGGADIGIPLEKDPYKINFDTVTIRDTKMVTLGGDINYDFGPVKFRAITGYTDFYAVRSSDNDFSPAPIAIDYNQTDVKTFSQEVQLLSGDKDSPFQWIVGGFYYEDDVKEFFFSDGFTNYPTAGLPALSAGGGIGLLPPGGAFPLNTPLSNFRSDTLAPVRMQTRSIAGFAQASYNITEALRVTAGGRYTSDRKRYAAGFSPGAPAGQFLAFDLFTQSDNFNFACGSVTPALAGSTATNAATGITVRCGDETFNFATFRGAIDYKISPDSLVYGSVSTGRRSGGFNNTPNLTNTAIPFSPEKVTAYEIGSKNQFLDNRLQLNVAAFYNKFGGLQVQRQVPSPSGLTTISIIENAGEARSYGAEIEAIAKPTRNITVNIAYVYLNSKYTKYETGTAGNGLGGLLGCPVAPATRDFVCESGGFGPNGFPFPNGLSDPGRFRQVLAGQAIYNYTIAGKGSGGESYSADIPLTPRHTVTAGIQWDIDLGAGGTLSPGAQTYLNSGFQNLDLNLPIAATPSFTKTDLRLGWRAANDRFTLQAFVENIENNGVLNRAAIGANRSINASYALPRTWGIRGGFQF